MHTCAKCAVWACTKPEREPMPGNCPMRRADRMEETFEEYRKPENERFFKVASSIEALGYCRWPRLKETAELCVRMNYKRIGMAFCIGLKREAKVIDAVFRDYGLDVVSVVCKAGGIPKQRVGIPEEHMVRPGTHEVMCNPIAQAEFINDQKTDFNVVVGLCVGHDSLFCKYSDAMTTTLIAKDRVLAHNPAGAVYCAEGYFKTRLAPSE